MLYNVLGGNPRFGTHASSARVLKVVCSLSKLAALGGSGQVDAGNSKGLAKVKLPVQY